MDYEAYLGEMKSLSLLILLEQQTQSKELDPKIRKIEQIVISRSFGCKSDLVRNFASAFVGHDFSKLSKSKGMKLGMVVVPLSDDVYGYIKNQPTCVVFDDRGWNMRQPAVNSWKLSYSLGSNLRMATAQEIENFYTKVGASKRNTERFCKRMYNSLSSSKIKKV